MTSKSMPLLVIRKLTLVSYQGVSRALVENSRTLRLPTHLHERLGLIRNAKVRLQEKGITPSVDVSLITFTTFALHTKIAVSTPKMPDPAYHK